MENKIPKKAQCIRNVSTWSNIDSHFKFDTNEFNSELLTEQLHDISPKMEELMKKIQDIDKNDMEKDGKYYKHIIYSDVQGIYGAKMVASLFLANGMSCVYGSDFKLKDSSELLKTKYNNFGLLTSSVVYKKPLPVKLKKSMMVMMNKRPDNIHGENVRFLILDSTFKEGLDVFDIKYIHILEPLLTKAEQTQVIGRGNRMCGSVGLPFDPKFGWKLKIFIYNTVYNYGDNEKIDLFKRYLESTGIDMSKFNFSAELEDMLKASAVDMSLTENIHKLTTDDVNRFKEMIEEMDTDKKVRRDKIVIKLWNKIYTNDTEINCLEKCLGVLQKVSNGLLLTPALHACPELHYAFNKKFPKKILCNVIHENKKYCKTVNQLWLQPIMFLRTYGKSILEKLNIMLKKKQILEKNYKECIDFIDLYYNVGNVKHEEKPPATQLNYLDMLKYIRKHYDRFVYPRVKLENLCDEQNKSFESVEKDERLIKLTPSQEFLRHYFVPSSPFKGMLIYHSVGTGKTCSAIATASTGFEKEGYTILWVTRHTLKDDIWKNVFDKVCHAVIRDKIKNGETIPDKNVERMKMMKNWFPVLSYKGFTNLIAKKNKYYNELVKINGAEDPFKKTLIVIDEIHKLFGTGLLHQERPNMTIFRKMLDKSYNHSGVDSVRLMLMTATPITEDPMSAIHILNLLKPYDERIVDNYKEFLDMYCTENGVFTETGAIEFMNRTSGYISYLDRSTDVRQFAYPEIENIEVSASDPLSVKKKEEIEGLKDKLKELENEKKKVEKEKKNKELKKYKSMITDLKKKIKDLNDLVKEDKSVMSMVEKCSE